MLCLDLCRNKTKKKTKKEQKENNLRELLCLILLIVCCHCDHIFRYLKKLVKSHDKLIIVKLSLNYKN